MPRLRLKICGIATIGEARAAVSAGADAIGLDPAAFPAGGPLAGGFADDAALSAISLALPPTVTPVLVTAALTAGAIAQQVDAVAAMAVQIARPLPASEYPGLRRIIRGRRIIQSIPIAEAGAGEAAKACAGFADALHFAPATADEARLCRRIADDAGLPVFLRPAQPASLAAMIVAVRPFALDASLPRRDGRLDEEALRDLAALAGA
ncbi:hypothetical protein [Labrys monachus]|uniref:Phosphoribosylanthranilate isomerase n=1 Tax=Labrys monachus TaxID=217067 RepID=A0ABU0F8X7_9HYPH|nr:hypothetical protein [Labrys monachus]MDQ0391025.1 phosphoribosylanthranilate isomerase [Labrys monachus]